MFGFLKNKSSTPSTPESAPAEKPGLFDRLKSGLSRTRAGLTTGLANLVLGKKAIDAEVLEELETRLILADVGLEATQAIIRDLTARVQRNQLHDFDALMAALQGELEAILAPCAQPLVIAASSRPYVILMVGINGAGKTTTIGKLAKQLQADGKSVMLAAGDTFRAAAVEQLQAWGARNDVVVIAQQRAGDPASVAYDAVQAAQARGVDVLIIDTAGRLHTQNNLMEELKKIRRVIAKVEPSAPHEIMLIVDASSGQNALTQAQQFHQAIGLTGVTLTKLDGTAKGGILCAIAQQTRLPIRYIGVGEGIDDLRPFDARAFAAALVGNGD